MDNKILELKEKFVSELEKIDNLADIENIRVSYLGKKGSVTDLLKGMKELSNDERKVFGQKVNELKGLENEKLQRKLRSLRKRKFKRKLSLCLSLTSLCHRLWIEAHITRLLLFKENVKEYLSQWALLLRITARL